MSTSRLSTLSLKNGLPKSNNIWDGTTGFFESIATVNVPSGGQASIEFTSIPSDYTHLQIRVLGRSNRALFTDATNMQFNSDTGSNYASHYFYGEGSVVYAGGSASQTNIQFYRISGTGANQANGFGACIVDILDYKNSNKYKTVRVLGGYDDNGQGQIWFSSGLWQSTNAITSIKVVPAVGTLFSQYTHFALYGIRSF